MAAPREQAGILFQDHARHRVYSPVSIGEDVEERPPDPLYALLHDRPYKVTNSRK